MKQTVILVRSASRNFPLDLEPELEKAGYEVVSLAGLEEFIVSPARLQPFVAVVELGMVADIDRALIVYDWNEHMQPLAAGRFLLLMGSKHLTLGERADRFRGAEIASLPQPARNLLFKIELQQRLVHGNKAAAKPETLGFTPAFEEAGGDLKRVLVLRGQDEKSGRWQNSGSSPSGKIRWRWIKNAAAVKVSAADAYSWVAESDVAPRFDPAKSAWLMEGEGDDLQCAQSGTVFFSALKSLDRLSAKGRETSQSNEARATREAAAAAAFRSEVEAEKLASLEAGKIALTEENTSGKSTFEKTTAATQRKMEAGAETKTPSAAGTSIPFTPPTKSELESKKKNPESLVSPAPASQQGWAAKASPEWNVKNSGTAPISQPLVNPPQQQQHASQAGSRAVSAAREALAKAEALLSGGKRESGRATSPEKNEAGSSTAALGGKSSTPSQPSSGKPLSAELRAAFAATAGQTPAAQSSTNPENAPSPSTDPVHISAPQFAGVNELEPSEGSSAKLDPFVRPNLGDAVPALDPISSGTGETSSDLQSTNLNPRNTDGTTSLSTAPLAAANAPNQSPPSFASQAPTKSEQNFSQSSAFDSTQTLPPASSVAREDAIHVGSRQAVNSTDGAISPGAEGNLGYPELALQQRQLDPSKKNLNDDESRRFLKDRLYHLMTLKDLGDKDSSWHPVGSHRIYLAAQHRYFGLKEPSQLLPLWIYEGELAPEFIDEKQSWKFYDRLPIAVQRLDLLPIEVLEQIYQMCGLPVPPDVLQKKEKGGRSVVLIDAENEVKGKNADHYQPEIANSGGAWSRIRNFFLRLFG